MSIKATTRKTKAGYFQPVIIVEQAGMKPIRHTPKDWDCPLVTRNDALKYANVIRNESIENGCVTI